LKNLQNKIVLITGASSGIGLACATAFAREGATLILVARRVERLQPLAEKLKKEFDVAVHLDKLDVRDNNAVTTFITGLPTEFSAIDILVNNAGLSRGFDPVQNGNLQDWDEMIDTNVKGLLYVTRAVLQGMLTRNNGHIINIGSIAGHQVYPNGNVYCASKFAVRALSQGLMMETVNTPLRVSTVDPGMVETEFSIVRYHGDSERAASTYKGLTPLSAEDIADSVLFVASRPPHANIAELVILPTDQASVYHSYRR